VFDHHFLERFRPPAGRAGDGFRDAGHYVLEDKHELLVPAIRASSMRTR
jgi:haloalkane dehalogenase